ncbi:MAG: Glu/Leu/Phe/Val dehydrogenase [Deltaproteobacteria bacterium]|nr:Glu/Leu/Phe/Val dehydrogenase [Deltaproteobacteria bacterium]MBI3295662.1 Glu/Leu/Phe/Val dehydrogenase [Deltaproteobacteria bacterium]
MASIETVFKSDHEEVVFFNDQNSGLKSIIAIHNTRLGPALGGLRMWKYDSVDHAIDDVLRLSRGMTYKAAVAGLNLGGGKAVIIADPKTDKSEALFRTFGSFVDSLNGRYITAEDVGTDVNDMEFIFMETSNVVGVAKTHGGSGDPSPWTARGVLEGIRACVEVKLGKDSLKGLSVAVQGAGNVGRELIELFLDSEMRVFVCDIDRSRCDQYQNRPNISVVATDEIYDADVDIFCPAALGAVINEKTLARLRCKIVAGSANNQLATPECGDVLYAKKILYAPDYAINAGGLMNVSIEFEGYDELRANRMIRNIYYAIKTILHDSQKENLPEYRCADRVAEKRMAAISHLRGRYLGKTQPTFPGRIVKR